MNFKGWEAMEMDSKIAEEEVNLQYLLEALEHIVDLGHDVSCGTYKENGKYPVGICDCHCSIARAAIAKARGRI